LDIATASSELLEVPPLPEAATTLDQIDTAPGDGRVAPKETEMEADGPPIVSAAEPGMPTAVRVITVADLFGR